MVQLILLRPGTTDYDQQARIQGTLDIPLTEAGRLEAQQMSEKLRPHLPVAVYCSPNHSAKETAAIVANAFGLKPKTLKKLHNVNQGLWQGMLVEEVHHKQPKVYKQWQEHPDSIRPPEGEIISEAIGRIEAALEKLARKHETEPIVLVAPEPLASLIQHVVQGTELGDLWKAANGCNQGEILHLEPAFGSSSAEPGKGNGKQPTSGLDTAGSQRTMVDGR